MSPPSRGGAGRQLESSVTPAPPSLPFFSAPSGPSAHSSKALAQGSNVGGHQSAGAAADAGRAQGQRPPPRRPAQDGRHRALCQRALLENDAMVYLDGPQVYSCGNCRTHLTSHDDIISKSFHGRHGRAYLFDQCVNVTTGPSEDRLLITGLHSVRDIACKRCRTVLGWTYVAAYERGQKYKEGKFIVEKVFLHLEESDQYDVDRPAGERGDRGRVRGMSWGSERSRGMSWGSERSPSVGSHAEATGTGGAASPGGSSGAGVGAYGQGGGSSAGAGARRYSPGGAAVSPTSPSDDRIIYEYR